MNQDHEDIWHVQLPTGEVRVFTLDQLDAAFQVGMIDEGCRVRREGSMTWRTLAEELAGEPQEVVSPTPAPVASYQPMSTAPMVLDDDELPDMRASSKKKVVAIIGGVAAIAAIAVFGVTKLGASAEKAAAAAGAAVNVAAPVAAPPPADPDPAAKGAKLSEEKRKALADMDKENERKAEQRRKTRLENAPQPSKPYKSEKPFTKGGNQYDPLNAKL